MEIGFIGLGVMGNGMVANLLKNNYEVSVNSRRKISAKPAIDLGAKWCESIKDLAKDKDIVITMVGSPEEVKQVYFAKDGLIESVKQGCVLIDMTTTDPLLSKKIYEQAKERGIYALDAPVSGGDIGAKNGTLTIMVGGEQEHFENCLDVFKAMGKNIKLLGEAGAGQHVKMANQIAVAGCLAGVAEAVSYGEKMGLNVTDMLDVISSGAAASWNMSNNGYKMKDRDYAPGFSVKHFVKDMNIAINCAQNVGLELSVLKDVCGKYSQLLENGKGESGTQALIDIYSD